MNKSLEFKPAILPEVELATADDGLVLAKILEEVRQRADSVQLRQGYNYLGLHRYIKGESFSDDDAAGETVETTGEIPKILIRINYYDNNHTEDLAVIASVTVAMHDAQTGERFIDTIQLYHDPLEGYVLLQQAYSAKGELLQKLASKEVYEQFQHFIDNISLLPNQEDVIK